MQLYDGELKIRLDKALHIEIENVNLRSEVVQAQQRIERLGNEGNYIEAVRQITTTDVASKLKLLEGEIESHKKSFDTIYEKKFIVTHQNCTKLDRLEEFGKIELSSANDQVLDFARRSSFFKLWEKSNRHS